MSAATFDCQCQIIACGACGPGFSNWQQLIQLFEGAPQGTVSANPSPKPEIIPANERRRAPLPVRLAVESSMQATQAAGIEPKELSSVFVSGFGDTQLTDYMCRALATENKQLSPTKFHNSVHNAAAGYWTISTGCERAANSVAGFQESASLALMEAVVQCTQEAVPILVSFYDAPVSEVLTTILGDGSAFSLSMVIAPVQSSWTGRQLSLNIVPEATNWPELQCRHPFLRELYASSPTARVLAIIETLFVKALSSEAEISSADSCENLLLPLAKGTSLRLTTDKIYEN